MAAWVKIAALFLILNASCCTAFVQRIYNKAHETAAGKIIYKPIFRRCRYQDFEIKPGTFQDIQTKFCRIREITVGSGPDEAFISGNTLQSWSNTIYFTKSATGSWNIAHVPKLEKEKS